MGRYDARPAMLDPGLTVLALRGLREPDGHYPFLQPFRHRRAVGRPPASTGSHRDGPLVSWLPLVRALRTRLGTPA
jgi:hypothetical protein